MRRIIRFSRVTFIPSSAFGLDTSALYHVGYVVADIEAAMAQFSDAIGARWVDHTVHARYLDENNQQVDTDLHTSFSLDGPVHIELIEAAPGTIWDLGTGAAIHHVGLWTDDVAAEAQRLIDSGMPVIAGGLDNDDPLVPGFFSYHRNPQGGNLELVHIDKQHVMHEWMRA
jgi:catechol 2,3-dioxygenase-like lactoylglutathione lyase family enzyme